MDLKEIRKSSSEELKQQVNSYKRELFAIKYRAAGGEIDTTNKSREIRRSIARILTVLKEREIEKSREAVGDGK